MSKFQSQKKNPTPDATVLQNTIITSNLRKIFIICPSLSLELISDKAMIITIIPKKIKYILLCIVGVNIHEIAQ
jgi:hypothetical protein